MSYWGRFSMGHSYNALLEAFKTDIFKTYKFI